MCQTTPALYRQVVVRKRDELGSKNNVRFKGSTMKISSAAQSPLISIQIAEVSGSDSSSSVDGGSSVSVAPSVQISKEARQKLEDERFADIDKSPLPEDVKAALKNIRKLQEKIAEKSQMLMDLMNDKTLSDDNRKRQQDVITAELHSMQQALGQATTALNNAMSMHNLNAKDRSLAKGLIGMK